uniref:Phage protein, HK97 gp10 family n=1 Tax=uncultured marine virus TaxID=186617 RepID=A0A0F7L6D0_9VIRU|nr:phage protein, HK97 gp10 family [uncultured marine virus]
MSVKISATDLKKLNKKLDNLKKFDKQTLSNELGRTGLDIASKAKKAAPVGKEAGGTLRQSIKSERKGKSVEVIAGANYAPYIEFGTGGMVKLDDMLELGIPASYAEQFKGKGIKEVNLPARPYFFSSAREGLNDLFIRLKKELRKSVK